MEWIKCSERLPKKFTPVLLAIAAGVVGEGRLREDGNLYWVDTDLDNDYILADGVTHWMPMPPPPPEEN